MEGGEESTDTTIIEYIAGKKDPMPKFQVQSHVNMRTNAEEVVAGGILCDLA